MVTQIVSTSKVLIAPGLLREEKYRGGSRTAATSKMEHFVIIVNGFQPLTIITKPSILDVAAVLDLPLKYTFQKRIIELVNWHKIPTDLVLNLDQTPLSYITVGNKTSEFEGATSVPVKGKWKNKQVAGTFTVLASGKFLPIQLICAAKTERSYLQGIKFRSELDVTHSENH